MCVVVCERGAANATVARVVEHAGVSRRTFYELFADRDDCFLAAFDEAVDRVADSILPAYRRGETWRERIRAALTAFLEFLDDHPCVGELMIVQALGAGPEALERRQCVLARVVAAVDQGRAESKSGVEPSLLTAEGVVGAVLSVIHSRLLEEGHPPLVELRGALMSTIVLPYAGPAAARQELVVPVAKRHAKPRGMPLDPLRELDMRLTYRTARVLMAVAQTPGASNRKLANAAEVSDQGQISKLLARLTTLGLVENAGRGLVRGEPNAWRLTARGRKIERAIDASAQRR
jgi:AcrR family transcriptional regulator